MTPRAEGATSRKRARRCGSSDCRAGCGTMRRNISTGCWVGTWAVEDATSATGVRVVAAFVVMLIALAVFVLARVGWWQQTFVSDRATRVLAWGLAVFFLGHGLVSFAEALAGMQLEWWLYGPAGLAIGLLALVVASSGGAWRIHRPHRTLHSR